jgi:hypothetical protein
MLEFIKTLNSKQEYFDFQALNKGFLSNFDKNPDAINNPEDVSGKAVEFGDAVDTLLYDGPTVFQNRFYTMDTPAPTSTALAFSEIYAQAILINGVVNRDVSFGVQICKSSNFWGNIKVETTLIAKFNDEIVWNYIQALVESDGKIILDSETHEKVLTAVATLKTNKFSKKYLFEKDDTFEVIYQLPIVFKYKDRLMKAMLDNVVIDHEKKVVYPVDLKTMGEWAENFPYNVSKYRYDLQAEIYTLAITAWVNEHHPGYEIQLFRFIVVSKNNVEKVLIFRLNIDEWRAKVNKHRITSLSTLDEILETYDWYVKNGDYQYPKEMYTQGFIDL